MNTQSTTFQKGSTMDHLPTFPHVHYKHADRGYFNLITSEEKGESILTTYSMYCMMRAYLFYVHDINVCPFTRALEVNNRYYFRECPIPICKKEFLHDIAQMQEDAMASLVPDMRTSEKDPFPVVTLLTAFTGEGATDISFYGMLEEVRVERRMDLIDKRMAIAIAHPLHPFGGNDNGTGKYGGAALPLFTSEVPMILTRYLHPFDIRFMHSEEEKRRFESMFQ